MHAGCHRLLKVPHLQVWFRQHMTKKHVGCDVDGTMRPQYRCVQAPSTVVGVLGV
jgi:hypothetical protein